MNQYRKRYRSRCRRMLAGEQTMEAVYRAMFEPSDCFDPETVVMTEEGAYVGRRRYRTYAQIQDDILQCGKALQAITGKQGTFIGLYAENSPQWIVLFWAILRSGNHPFLINLRQPEQMTRDILETLQADTVVCVDHAPQLAAHTVTWQQLQAADTSRIVCDRFGDQVALATSGTTLNQKICIYTGREIIAQLDNVHGIDRVNSAMITGYRGTIRQLVFLPFYHIFGLEAVLLWFSLLGATFVFPANMNPKTLLRTIRDHGVSHIFAVPLFWDAVRKGALRQIQEQNSTERFEKGAVWSMRLRRLPMGKRLANRMMRELRQQLFGDSIVFCISGGSYISQETLTFFNALGYPLCNGFGMSEIGISSVELSKKAHRRIQGSIGQPFDSVDYRIDSRGHLLVRGSSLCKNLIINGQSQLAEEWMDTGDLVAADGKGGYRINGRVSDLVFDANGENLNPELAERAFQLPEAAQFSVLGDENNEKLMLVVQLPEELSAQQRQQLQSRIDACNRTLPSAYQIKRICYTYDPLKSENAIKISRAWLRRAIVQGRVTLQDGMETEAKRPETAPRSRLREQLREKMAAMLELEPEKIDDRAHFMNDLGGSSLDFFSLISEIEREYGITLDFEPENFRYCLEDFERIVKENLE